MFRFYALLVALLLGYNSTVRGADVGSWTTFPAIGAITSVEKAGTVLYVLAGTTLFSVDTADYYVAVYDKASPLSDTNVEYIAWCAAAKKLVIIYSNGNIDLLRQGSSATVVNIPDYYMYSTTADKTIFSVDVYGDRAYISTGFGIVELDVTREEIANTYSFGERVGWTYRDDTYLYAECPRSGLWRAALSSNLLDPNSWSKSSTTYTAKDTTIAPDLLATAQAYLPNGPTMGYFGFITMVDGVLYTTPGQGGEAERVAAVQIYDGTTWTVLEGDTGLGLPPLYRGLFALAVDPTTPNHWYTGAISGLYEYRNGTIINGYYWENSPLERAATVSETNVNYTEVTTLCYDEEGKLWFIQGITATPGIYCLTADGTFTLYEHAEMMGPAGYSWTKPLGLACAASGKLWFVNNNWRAPAFASYDKDRDQLTTYTTFINEDGTVMVVNYVRCWAEESNGNIWIGTDVGPAYLSAEEQQQGGTTLIQHKIARADDPSLADYLLAGVDISSIVIDAGDRKWFGTNGAGLYLISADNNEEIEHFTAATSPLLSDIIEALYLDNNTGTLYIGTDKGLCAYASAVTTAREHLTKDDIYAYPNPVQPDYDGVVTIVGLTYGAQVCITTTSGAVVRKGSSTGGTFSWDLCDNRGRKVASGVYLVLVSTAEGKETVATKVAVVR